MTFIFSAEAFAAVPNIALGGGGAAAFGGAGSKVLGGAGNDGLGGSFTSSGSFSKASASSFASSSASSYSFSGSGSIPGHSSVNNIGQYPFVANQASGTAGYSSAGSGADSQNLSGIGSGVYPVQDTNNSNKCGPSGNCNTAINTKPGANNVVNFNVAQSGAVAGANTFGGLGSGSKCIGSNCETNISDNKCPSGDCLKKSQAPENSNNDIPVNIPGYSSTKTSYDADKQSTNLYNHNDSDDFEYSSNCPNNNCDASSSKPGANPVEANNQVLPNSNNPSVGSHKCNTPNCNDFSYNLNPGNPKDNFNPEVPVTYLTAPKQTGSKNDRCSAGNCQNSDGVNSFSASGNNGFTNNNNEVPFIHTNYPGYNPSVNSGNIHGSGTNFNANSASHSEASSHNTGINYNTNNPSGINCNSPSCTSLPNNPSYSTGTFPTNKGTPNFSSNGDCSTINCKNYPSTPVNNAMSVPTTSGSFNSVKPNYDTDEKKPNSHTTFTGSFGGPPGILRPNDYRLPTMPVFGQQSKPTNIQSHIPTGVESVSSTPANNAKPNDDDKIPDFIPLQSDNNANANSGSNSDTLSQTTGINYNPSGSNCKSPSCNTSNSQGSPGVISGSNCGSSNCGNYPLTSTNTGVGASATTGSFNNVNPNYNIQQKIPNSPSYTGGFGGAPGILKPNDYTVPSKPGFVQHNKPSNPIVPVSAVISPAHNVKPNDESQQELNNNKHSHTQTSSSAAAVAGASGGIYTGGFGGAPGFLRPYDNLDKSIYIQTLNKITAGQQSTAHNLGGNPTGHHYHGTIGSGSAISGAFAGAGAGSVTGAGTALGGSNNYYGKPGDQHAYNAKNHNVKGCSGECQNGDHGYNAGSGLGIGGGLGISSSGLFDGLAGGLNTAGAVSKGVAGAISSAGASAGSFGFSGSLSGSAATAHSSSGAISKSG